MLKVQPFLTGRLIYLRGLLKEDLPNLARWADDEEVTRYMFTGTLPSNVELLIDEYERMRKSTKDVVFAIVDKNSHEHIGWCGLYDIHAYSRKAEFRILIGEKAFWGRGYGTEATLLTAFYAFDRLNLNRFWLGVNGENRGGIKAYEKAGLVHEGVLRQDHYRNSRYYDNVRMGILREEFYPKYYELVKGLMEKGQEAR